MTKNQAILDRMEILKNIFIRKRCVLSDKAIRAIACCNLFGYGASYEATIMIMAGTVQGLLMEMGETSISPEMIGKGLPSREKLKESEKDLGLQNLPLSRP